MVLNVRPSPSARGALKYFKESLQIGDYLGGSAIEAPVWRGKTADILGLTNKVVSERDFAALILGADPRALQSDFQRRLNDFRYGRSDALELGVNERLIQRVRKNRVPGIEFTFSVPKGVSLQWAAGDERIRTALQKAIDDTMEHVQQHAQTRVRRDGKNENRTTQNLLWASFTHETSRPVEHDDGTVTIDPHLHCHAYVPNVTYDETEKRFKSTKYRGLKCRADYFQEYFESLLAREIQQLGYEVGRRGISWDVTHISPELCETFSQRTAEVERRAAELGITSDKVKGELAAQTRIAKGAAEGIEWRSNFKARLPQHELQRLRAMTQQTMERGAQPALPAKERADIAEQAIEWALSRQLERRSTTYDHKVKADAMRWATGLCLPKDIDAAFRAHQLVIGREDDLMQRAVTKDSLVIEERTLIKFVRDTKNKHKPLVEQPRISRALYEAFDKDPVLEREGVQAESIQLPEQLAAIIHVLSSTDQVMSIRGQAGTGKSYLLQALNDELQRNDIKPVALAPTAAASRGSLREAGLT
ncbi:MAG: MobF family relaxase, partial [Myxococcota bacterium]